MSNLLDNLKHRLTETVNLAVKKMKNNNNKCMQCNINLVLISVSNIVTINIIITQFVMSILCELSLTLIINYRKLILSLVLFSLKNLKKKITKLIINKEE